MLLKEKGSNWKEHQQMTYYWDGRAQKAKVWKHNKSIEVKLHKDTKQLFYLK